MSREKVTYYRNVFTEISPDSSIIIFSIKQVLLSRDYSVNQNLLVLSTDVIIKSNCTTRDR